MNFVRNLVHDLATLKLPVTAAAFVATAIALIQPFGVSLGADTTAKVTAALVLVGVVAEYLKTRRAV